MKKEYIRMTSESKNVSCIRYRAKQKELVVEFHQGVYAYKDVPESKWDEALMAESVGSFVNKELKGKYEFYKVD